MTRVTSVPRLRRSRLRAFAAAFVAVAQFAVSSFAPMVDGQAGAGAPTHVESFGVHLHFAHNPDDCAACSAQTLIGLAAATPAYVDGPAAAAAEFVLAPLPAPSRGSWRADAPRAPPLRPARTL
jgi:hypothetical protein